MATTNITLDDILAEDGGERYFTMVYPALAACFKDPRKKVAIRDDDKTQSAGVFRHKTAGIWMLNDFGGAGSKAITAFQLCQQVNKVDAGEAFKIFAKFYGHDIKVEAPKAAYTSRLPKEGELPGQIVNQVYKELTYADALVILSKYAWEGIQWAGTEAKDDAERLTFAQHIFKYYKFEPLHSYEKVSEDGKLVHIYTSTENFPMFAINEGEFQKIYKPRAEKAYRFLWAGKKPENYMHGLAQHLAYLKANKEENTKIHNKAAEANKDVDKGALLPEKFEEMILVSGGSDAINVAAMGFRVVWMNSETAKLQFNDLKTINSISRKFYNLPDIDPTGRAQAKELAWEHIDIYTIWLPSELSLRGDGKGGFCKDIRDYLKYYRSESFNLLVKNSLPFRFWDEMEKRNSKGNLSFRFGRQEFIYEFNNVRGYNFLQMNGFWRYADERYKEGSRLIKIDGNIVRDVLPNEVKNYIHVFLKERQQPEDLRNVMYNSPRLSESSLSNLDEIELDFKNYGPDFQYIFFNKKVWKVTADTIETAKMPSIYVWKDKILGPEIKGGGGIDFSPKILPPMFTIVKSPPAETSDRPDRGVEKDWGVSFHPEAFECEYLKFTIQTCKIHWRAELEERFDYHELMPKERIEYAEKHNLTDEVLATLEHVSTLEAQEAYKKKYQFRLDGSLLTETEQAEQTLAFTNRVFLIGYLLHKYKDPTKPWAGYVMDYRISEEGASNGRAGKGLLALALKKMLPMHFWQDARDPKMLDDQFLFGGLKKGNDLIHFEDWDEFLNFERLYNILTSSVQVNTKGYQAVTYKYDDYGKILIDTNFGDRYMSGSAKGRKLWSVFGDYYHEDLDHYREVRTPQTELGRRMFDDWDEAEWNRFYNFMVQCLQFYLSMASKAIKIDPPFSNILKRNSLSIMGESFRQWADTYFGDGTTNSRMNEAVIRTDAQEDYMKFSNLTKHSSQAFFKKLQAWCEFSGNNLNPEHVQGWQKAGDKKIGYIKRSVPKQSEPGKYTTIEYVYIEPRNKANQPDSNIESVPKNNPDAPLQF